MLASTIQFTNTHQPTNPCHHSPNTPTHRPKPTNRSWYECEVCTRRRRHKNPPPEGGGLLVPSGPNSMPKPPRPVRALGMSTMFPPISTTQRGIRRHKDGYLPTSPD